MKNIGYFFLFLICFLFPTLKANAQDVDLGFLSQNELSSMLQNEVTFKISDTSVTLTKNELSSWLTETSRLQYDQSHKSEIEDGDLCRQNKSLACKLLFSYQKEGNVKKTIQEKLSADLIQAYLEKLAAQINRDPVNPRMNVADGRVAVFDLSQDGIQLDVEKSAAIIIDRFKNKTFSGEINLAYAETKPEINADTIDNMGIDTLIGEGHSNFKGSPKNRVFNINVATDRFNGVLIKPGEEFSFVKVLGEVDGEHGYLPELVIKKDKTEPEFGGGICQVSTTAFRAAIYSGLEITARRNHAYPVSYYNPQGMDSTVYVPKPDLRFINNTPGYILIQTKIEGTELIFQFYGTSDGRRTNVIGPTILERNPDGSMKTTFTQQVYDKDNNLIREDEFKSSYESPSKFPHPGQTSGVLTEKPKKWSDHEWRVYKTEHNIN